MSDTSQKTAHAPSEVKRINDSIAELEKTVSIVCERISMVRTRLLGSDESPCSEVDAASNGWFNETLHSLKLLNERLRELNVTKINDLQQATELEGK